MTGSHEPPGYRQILVFWLPLLGTWLMMSVEGPMLSALISRMADPKFNLAAYGVAFALALLSGPAPAQPGRVDIERPDGRTL